MEVRDSDSFGATIFIKTHNSAEKVCPECAMGIVRNHVETKFFDKEAPTIELKLDIKQQILKL